MTVTVLVPVAHGSEDLETVAIVDVLRRADFQLTIASVEDTNLINAARKTNILADCSISECTHKEYDLIALPGGMPGAQRLAQHKVLAHLLTRQRQSSKWISAICASPAVVLQPLGLLDDAEKVTCYPAFKDQIDPTKYLESEVVICEKTKLITASGPAAAISFALEIIKYLNSSELSKQVAKALLFKGSF
jgi:4-methyl-5(b-hydroxyethyl)-thiazole monophosphate biosynthesis